MRQNICFGECIRMVLPTLALGPRLWDVRSRRRSSSSSSSSRRRVAVLFVEIEGG